MIILRKITVLLFHGFWLGIFPAQVESAVSSGLSQVLLVTLTNGDERLVTPADHDFKKMAALHPRPLFQALVTNAWPPAMLPLFLVEKSNHLELRRLPLRGNENSSEPLFFALPPGIPPDTGTVAGRWEVVAHRADRSRALFGLELAVDGRQLAGRFDQNTEYRFAYLLGGTVHSNRVQLEVEYINDKYLLEGEWRGDKLSGDWKHRDGEEKGTWEGTRAVPFVPPGPEKTIRLFEWRHPGGRRRYRLEEEKAGEGWTREKEPLCRVWALP